MSYYLLLKNKIVNESDIIDIVFENGMIDFIAEVEKSDNVVKAKISNIDGGLKTFYVFLIDYNAGAHISVTGLKNTSIIEKSEIDNPNIKFKHKDLDYSSLLC